MRCQRAWSSFRRRRNTGVSRRYPGNDPPAAAHPQTVQYSHPRTERPRAPGLKMTSPTTGTTSDWESSAVKNGSSDVLLQSEALYRLFARNLADGAVFLVDTNLRFLVAEGPLLGEFGMSRETLEGRTVGEAVLEPLRQRVEERFPRALAGNTASYETNYGTRTLRAKYLPVRDSEGRVVAALSLITDVTDRRSAEQALVDREAELRLVMDAQPALLSYIDSGFRYRRVNQAYERWFGRTASEVEGRHVREVLGKSAWEAVRPYMERALAGEEVTYERELPYSSGSRWVHVTYTPDRRADGTVHGFVVHVMDIGEQKRIEQALHDHQKRLAVSLTALQEADRLKNEFLATLSHELRNPLAPIRYAADLLSALEEDPPSRPIQVINRHLRHLVHLVDELLDVSRIATGKIRLAKGTVDLAPIVHHAVEAAFPAIEAARQELSVSLPEDPVRLDGDGYRLTQVLTNLLNNASRHTPHGGRISITATIDGLDCVISVTDTGAGLEHENLARVFEMFTQLGTADHTGLGIGLTLVKGIVELHGGTAEARSAGPGRGSEFLVTLPVVSAPAETLPQEPPRPPAGGRYRVLVVDDNTDAAEMMKMYLELQGHDVRVAESGRAALAVLAEFQAEVGLLDIGLPDMSGYELAQMVRSNPTTHGMGLIAVTGWGQHEDRQRAIQAGFQAHVTKPADFEEIQRLLTLLTS
jgi:PAS domain S-box-containing protein